MYAAKQNKEKINRVIISNVIQYIIVTNSDIGKLYSIRLTDGNIITARLISMTNGYYHFETDWGKEVIIHGQNNILSEISTQTFNVSGITFQKPSDASFRFTPFSANQAVSPLPKNIWKNMTGKERGSGVKFGDIGSYGGVLYLEQTGDGLTGDHQPSGAAIKEAIRQLLYSAIDKILTRSMASNAYKRAITIVVDEQWHRKSSRTFGGRNTPDQIKADAQNLLNAAINDWSELVPHLKEQDLSDKQISELWDAFNQARADFFQTGKPQWV